MKPLLTGLVALMISGVAAAGDQGPMRSHFSQDRSHFSQNPSYFSQNQSQFRQNDASGERGWRHDRPGFDNRPGFNDRPGFDGRPDFGNRPGFNDRPGFDGRPGFDNRPGFSDRPGFDGRPGFDNRPGFNDRPGFDGRPDFGNRPGFNDRPGSGWHHPERIDPDERLRRQYEHIYDAQRRQFEREQRATIYGDAPRRYDDNRPDPWRHPDHRPSNGYRPPSGGYPLPPHGYPLPGQSRPPAFSDPGRGADLHTDPRGPAPATPYSR